MSEQSHSRRGVVFALAAALLFGVSTPLVKPLLVAMPPALVAGLLYAGSGLGLSVLGALLPGRREARIGWKEAPWLGAAILLGGVLAPLLLMSGLRGTTASSTSLLLNLEGVFTALLAWFAFHENFDRRIAAGMVLIMVGAAVLSWPGDGKPSVPLTSAAIVGACLCWALDNNLTQKVSGGDPLRIAAWKGLVAGAVNVGVAVAMGASMPPAGPAALAMLVGALGYGLSLSLFVIALRSIGTARTAAYFSVAPFIGAIASLAILGEPPRLSLAVAGAFMGAGVWLHLSEHHAHEHRHEELVHSHRHIHDRHHRHGHDPADLSGEPHAHEHAHEPFSHAHPHYPDLHHRHRHGRGSRES